MLADLSSMNGTRVNGWRLGGPSVVRVGDQVRSGDTRFVITT